MTDSPHNTKPRPSSNSVDGRHDQTRHTGCLQTISRLVLSGQRAKQNYQKTSYRTPKNSLVSLLLSPNWAELSLAPLYKPENQAQQLVKPRPRSSSAQELWTPGPQTEWGTFQAPQKGLRKKGASHYGIILAIDFLLMRSL